MWILLALTAPAAARAQDVLDTADLGTRGAVFKSRFAFASTIRDVIGLGDFNGDGLGDFAASDDGEFSERGVSVAYVLYGHPSFPSGGVLGDDVDGFSLTIDPDDLEVFGHPGMLRFEALGDINGDGLADVLLGAPLYRAREGVARGAVFLIYGTRGRTGILELRDVVDGAVERVLFFSSQAALSGLGTDCALLDDVNADGKSDLALAHFSTPYGHVRLLFTAGELSGEIDVPREADALIILRDAPGVADVGDFDGDGLGDFAVMDRARVYILSGRPAFPALLDLRNADPADGLRIIEKATLDDRLLFGQPGQVAGLGDLDGDGLTEILVGSAASGFSIGGGNFLESEVFLFWGRRDFPGFVHAAAIPDGLATRFTGVRDVRYNRFGVSVASAGDVNLDGIPDLLIGAPDTTGRMGEAYLVHGRPDFPTEVSLAEEFDGLRILGARPDNFLGQQVARAGDVTGDGVPEIFVVARGAGGQTSEPGELYVIYGADPVGVPFVRGDASDDGAHDLTDVLTILTRAEPAQNSVEVGERAGTRLDERIRIIARCVTTRRDARAGAARTPGGLHRCIPRGGRWCGPRRAPEERSGYRRVDHLRPFLVSSRVQLSRANRAEARVRAGRLHGLDDSRPLSAPCSARPRRGTRRG